MSKKIILSCDICGDNIDPNELMFSCDYKGKPTELVIKDFIIRRYCIVPSKSEPQQWVTEDDLCANCLLGIIKECLNGKGK